MKSSNSTAQNCARAVVIAMNTLIFIACLIEKFYFIALLNFLAICFMTFVIFYSFNNKKS